jgi:hypothetical protein
MMSCWLMISFHSVQSRLGDCAVLVGSIYRIKFEECGRGIYSLRGAS